MSYRMCMQNPNVASPPLDVRFIGGNRPRRWHRLHVRVLHALYRHQLHSLQLILTPSSMDHLVLLLPRSCRWRVGRVISRQGPNHSYLMWQGGKDEGGATDWNATGHLRWGQEQRYVLHPHETHGWSETWSSNRLVISATTLPVEKGKRSQRQKNFNHRRFLVPSL